MKKIIVEIEAAVATSKIDMALAKGNVGDEKKAHEENIYQSTFLWFNSQIITYNKKRQS